MSRVYLLAAGARDGSKRTSGTFAKWLLGSRKAKGKCCLGLFDLYQSPPPHSATVEVGGGGYRVKVTLPLLCFPLSLGQMQLSLFLSLSATPPPQLAHRAQGPPFKEQKRCDEYQEFLQKVEVSPASAVGLQLLWQIQGTWCPGLRCGIASELKRRPPSGYIPDVAGAGGEVISGVFHADQARAGMSPSQTSEGRKEAGTEPGCAQPWLSRTAASTSSFPS